MLFWLCAAAPFTFLFISLLLGSLASNFNQQNTAISYLVHSNYGGWQTLNFIVCGLLTVGLACLIRDAAPADVRNTHFVKIGVLVLGLSLVLLGIFPTDKVGETTPTGQIHGAVFVITVLLQAGLQLAFAFSNLSNLPLASISLLVTGTITALGLPGMLIFSDWRGITQRILVGAIMWWVTIGALILRK